jgi:hypothetical protein
VPALLAEDASWSTQPTIYLYLHQHRQDLLTPYLGQRAYRGRFSTGKTRFVLPLTTGFVRWTPKQQAAFAATLEQLTTDADRDTPTALRAIDQLAALPMIEPRRLIALARTGKPALQEAALRALGRLDDDRGVGVLIEALADDRARVAVYALRQALLHAPTPHALDLLSSAPTERVTVAKEIVRLIGEFPGPAAFERLRSFESRPLHRDVRVALLRAYWRHRDRPEVWEAFERAAGESDPALVSGVVRVPADRLDLEGRRRLARLLGRLLDHPDSVVRVAALDRCASEPVDDPEGSLLGRACDALGSGMPDLRYAAANAIATTATADDAGRVAVAACRLAPNRRALETLCRVLTERVVLDGARLAPVVSRLVMALASDPLTAVLRVGLASALGIEALADLCVTLGEADLLHADTLRAAIDALQQGTSLGSGLSRRASLSRLEQRLTRHQNPRLRRLALAALVAQNDSTGGWDDDRLTRLRGFRADPAALVAAAAQFTLPATEFESRVDI